MAENTLGKLGTNVPLITTDFIIKQVFDIVHYIKLGIESEYVSKTDNDFYNSQEFKEILSESIVEYRSGKTEDMDIL